MSRGNDPVTVFDLILKVETDAALGIEADESEVIWLPKSQIESHTLVRGEQGIAVMPRWLAEKHSLDYDE